MFLRLLINPKPSIILFFIVFCVFFASLPLIQFNIDFIFQHFYFHPALVLILAILMPCLISTGLNNIIYEKNVIRKENLVVGFVFVLISSPFANTIALWISSFLLLFLFNFLIESYQKEFPFSKFYNSSVILSLLTFIHPNLIYLIVLLLIHAINYENISWRIIFTSLLGVLTPYVFYFVFVVMTNSTFYLPDFLDFKKISFESIQNFSHAKKTWLLILILIVIISFFELFSWLYKKSIKSRKTFITIVWFFLITTLIALSSGWEYFYFSLTPLAIIIGNYFVYTKKRAIANILFLMLIISSMYYKYMIGFNM